MPSHIPTPLAPFVNLNEQDVYPTKDYLGENIHQILPYLNQAYEQSPNPLLPSLRKLLATPAYIGLDLPTYDWVKMDVATKTTLTHHYLVSSIAITLFYQENGIDTPNINDTQTLARYANELPLSLLNTGFDSAFEWVLQLPFVHYYDKDQRSVAEKRTDPEFKFYHVWENFLTDVCREIIKGNLLNDPYEFDRYHSILTAINDESHNNNGGYRWNYDNAEKSQEHRVKRFLDECISYDLTLSAQIFTALYQIAFKENLNPTIIADWDFHHCRLEF